MSDRLQEIRARLEVAQDYRVEWPDHKPRTLAEFIAHAPADIAALVAEVERLLALVPAPPKTPPPGEVWRHSGTFDIDGTDFAVDLIMVGAHRLIAYYPSNNQDLRNRCGYSPHPVIWVDGAIYWEDGLIATEQEEDFCAEVVEALIRFIQEHGDPPDDFGDLGLDTFGRDVGIEVSNG